VRVSVLFTLGRPGVPGVSQTCLRGGIFRGGLGTKVPSRSRCACTPFAWHWRCFGCSPRAGRTRAIAADLVVVLDTVKKHVSHLLDKLGATNRTEAVARARELALIL
jgi:hypothetical protein